MIQKKTSEQNFPQLPNKSKSAMHPWISVVWFT